ncbi:Piso0_002776 [Millerozyma farinosa CBS 7064]|uniref:Piso0_002776 protein n=1 Tax=Pichia sorbitophila (strain ATCC MYA-4447 / BCRC 22081 / CBS 7064 / NBRC 10061 / NRRL Y-12695) TaxID=559304 RepID=G8YFY1_PICSO|nr:Piso0_002776 [Millerozyma farinosa CBS 7064]
MSAFSEANFKGLNYDSFRPHYPPSFYELLYKFLTKSKDGADIDHAEKVIDLGCGTGISTYPLLNIADTVIGVDVSQRMVDTANKLTEERCKELQVSPSRIKFIAGDAETFVESPNDEIRKNGVDLITCAECLHWFGSYPSFFKACHQLLKPGGTLAYWYYRDPIVVSISGDAKGNDTELISRINRLYLKYVYEDDAYLGPYWENPGRHILYNMYRDINKHIPEDLFTDITIKSYVPEPSLYPGDDDLKLVKKDISIVDFVRYIETYSAYHTYKDKTGDKEKILENFKQEATEGTGIDAKDTVLTIIWHTGYTFMKKE